MALASTTASAVGQTDNIRAELILNDNRNIPITIADASGQSKENINIVITINRDAALSGTVVKQPFVVNRLPFIQNVDEVSILESEKEPTSLKLMKFDEKLNAFNDAITPELRRSGRIAASFQETKKTTPSGVMTIAYLDRMKMIPEKVVEVVATPKADKTIERATPPMDIAQDITKLFSEGDSKDAMNDTTKLELTACQKILAVPSTTVLPRIAPAFLPSIVFMETKPEASSPTKIIEEKPPASVSRIKFEPTSTIPPKSDDFQTTDEKDSMNSAKKSDFGQSRKLALISSETSLARVAPRECPTVVYVIGRSTEIPKTLQIEEPALVQRSVTVATNADVAVDEFTVDNDKTSFNDVAKREASRCYPLLPNIKVAAKVPRPTVAFMGGSNTSTPEVVPVQEQPVVEIREPPKCPEFASDLQTTNFESMNNVLQNDADESQNRRRPVRARFSCIEGEELFTVEKMDVDGAEGHIVTTIDQNTGGGPAAEHRTAVEIATRDVASTLTKVRVDTVTTTTTSTTVTVSNTVGQDDRKEERISRNVISSYKQDSFEKDTRKRRSPERKKSSTSPSTSKKIKKGTESQKPDGEKPSSRKVSKNNKASGSVAAAAKPVNVESVEEDGLHGSKSPGASKKIKKGRESEKPDGEKREASKSNKPSGSITEPVQTESVEEIGISGSTPSDRPKVIAKRSENQGFDEGKKKDQKSARSFKATSKTSSSPSPKSTEAIKLEGFKSSNSYKVTKREPKGRKSDKEKRIYKKTPKFDKAPIGAVTTTLANVAQAKEFELEGLKSLRSPKSTKKESESSKSDEKKRRDGKFSIPDKSSTTKAVINAPIELDIPSVLNDDPPPVAKIDQVSTKVANAPKSKSAPKTVDSRKRKTLFTTPSRTNIPQATKTAAGRGARQAVASKSTISALVEETNVGTNAVENRAEIEISNIAPGTKVAVDMEAKQAAPENECSTSFLVSSAKDDQKTEAKTAVLKDRKEGDSSEEEKMKKQSKQGKVKKSEIKKTKKN